MVRKLAWGQWSVIQAEFPHNNRANNGNPDVLIDFDYCLDCIQQVYHINLEQVQLLDPNNGNLNWQWGIRADDGTPVLPNRAQINIVFNWKDFLGHEEHADYGGIEIDVREERRRYTNDLFFLDKFNTRLLDAARNRGILCMANGGPEFGQHGIQKFVFLEPPDQHNSKPAKLSEAILVRARSLDVY